MKNSTFRQVRFGLYMAFVLNGIVQWLIPFPYRCNLTGEECFACGLRTAVNLFLQGRFEEAWQSNKLILALAAVGLIMGVDVLYHLYQHGKAKTKHNKILAQQPYGCKVHQYDGNITNCQAHFCGGCAGRR